MKDHQYSSISIDRVEFADYSVQPKTKVLSNLSNVNILIGPNNTGKSRFLRTLFSLKNTEFNCKSIDIEKINRVINELKEVIYNFYNDKKISEIEGVNVNIPEIKFWSKGSELSEIFNRIQQFASITGGRVVSKTGWSHSPEIMKAITEFFRTTIPIYLVQLDELKNITDETFQKRNIYIPTLRGLRNTNYSQDRTLVDFDSYKFRTIKDYFPDEKSFHENIYTGLSLYDDVKKLLLGSGEKRQKIREFEDFLKRNFFINQDFNIIPHIDDNAVHVKIGEDERPIYMLGEGVQALIILTYPLFFNQNENLNVFFEEPDTYLHPGFQRIFLETLMLPEFKHFQFYLTTHSNHFLDMTLDFKKISVYAFQKRGQEFIIDNVENTNRNLLELLGVRNSSVYLTNCTIWVEGITDRIYIRKFLELYQHTQNQKFLEDIHFSFLEYGGGNITHWSFLENTDELHPNINVKALCGKMFLITDQDGAGLNKNGSMSKKMERQEKLKINLGDQYYCLKSHEIENLLSEEVVINVIRSYESYNGLNLDFSKIKRSKYVNAKLGAFIDKNVAGLSKTYAAESGTIKDKVGFSKKAVAVMTDINHLTPETKELTANIFKFIKKNNNQQELNPAG
ncbi:MAG: hypothetical protein K0S44_1153 [Bacteroidetes bacterium]|jgi:predicted ATP-dependent endonuclease of OLD family|nr:hypothetical protein [Bacteroidota bacterium]